MLAISFIAGILYIALRSRKTGQPPEQYLTIAYILILGGMIGARLFFILFHLEEFSGQWLQAINPFSGGEFGIAGLNLYGGIVVAVAASAVYCRVKKWSVLDTFDQFAPTLGLGLFFTRIGCFLNGCCFGTPTDLPWGITYPPGSIPSFVFPGLPLHPAQLYSAAYGASLFIVLHFVLTRRRFVGQVVAILFMAEACFRFAIEFVRYYENAMITSLFGLELTYNMAISAGLFLLGAAMYIHGSLTSSAYP